jgi:flagella basal body P-ring formation protein FlgA
MMISFILGLTVLAANTLPNQVVVQAGDVTVADLIPDDQGVRGALLRQYSTVGLGKAPDHGKKRRISGRYIRRLLRASGLPGIRVPDAVTLVGASGSITEAQQLAFIKRKLQAQFGKRLKLERVEAVGELQTLEVPPGSRPGRVRLAPGARLAARTSVRLDIMKGKRLVKKRILQVRLVGSAQVRVTTEALDRGHRLTRTDVQETYRSLDLLPRRFRLRPFAVHDQVLRRSLPQGAVLLPSLLQPPVIIHRGDPIQLELRQAGMILRARGKALANGIVGQQIAVLNAGSGKRVQGRVKAPGLVEVTP